MRKNSEKTPLLTGADGGTCFTAVSIITLLVSVVLTVIVLAKGESGLNFINSTAGQYLNYVLSSVALAATAGFCAVKSKCDVKEVCAFKPFKPIFALIAAGIAFGSLYGLGWINDAFISLLKNFGYKGSSINIPHEGFGNFLLCALLICVLPAFFEEFIFRGFLLGGSKRLGDAFAVLAGGALFSLFHKNPAQTPYQFIEGALFCLLALKSGSIIPSMLTHFINNFYIVCRYYIVYAVSSDPENYALPVYVSVPLMVVALGVLAVCVWFLIKKCKKSEYEQKVNELYAKNFDIKSERRQFFLFSAIGILVCAASWLAALFN